MQADTPLSDVLQQYLAERRLNVKYAVAFTLAVKRFGGTVADLSQETLDGFAKRLHDNGLAPRTIRNDVDLLYALWRFAHRQGFGQKPPGRHYPGRRGPRTGRRRAWRWALEMDRIMPAAVVPQLSSDDSSHNSRTAIPVVAVALPEFDGAAVAASAPVEGVTAEAPRPGRRKRYRRWRA